eukprot:122622_1
MLFQQYKHFRAISALYIIAALTYISDGAYAFDFKDIAVAYKPTLRLPDLFEFMNGSKVTTPTQWKSRREELKYLLDTYILGTKPDTVPNILSLKQLNATQYNYGISTYYQFTLDLKNSTAIIFELICPLNTKQSTFKFPIIISQYNHREWLLRAVQRGLFCAVRTPTADTRDDSEQFASLYPHQTWGTIARRAWLDSIIITCLQNNVFPLQPHLNITNIGITGHSRNGKQSLIAAAYDERITVVVGSSSGMPVSSPFRYTSRDFFGETVHTPYFFWWTEKFQEFYGKEQNCPADGHFITALIAPRYIMLANALNDNAGDNSFANDKNFMASKEVYNLLNVNPNDYFTVQHRQGAHHGFLRFESYLDFFTYGFGFNVSSDILNWIKHPLLFHTFTFKEWNNTYNECLNRTIPLKTESLTSRISWLLGSDSLGKGGGYSCGASYSEESSASNNFVVNMMNENNGELDYRVKMQSFSFGGYIQGDIYYSDVNININLSLPVIIHLHPYSYACGFVPDYIYSDMIDPFYYHFAARGYVVITYHQLGFGERIYEGKYFYDRYGCGEQSRFGHMVRDVRLLIDFIQCLTKTARNNNVTYECSTGEIFTNTYKNILDKIPNLDMSRLSLVGYALGGAVGLHAAALDKRIMNVATIAGWTPFRNNTNDLPNAGNYYFYDIHGLVPKLGFFKGKEEIIPYDYNELFQQISPRKILIYSPTKDRNAYYNAVGECVANVKSFWNNSAAKNFTAMFPDDVSDFGIHQYNVISDWLES